MTSGPSSFTGGLNNNGGGIVNAGTITGASFSGGRTTLQGGVDLWGQGVKNAGDITEAGNIEASGKIVAEGAWVDLWCSVRPRTVPTPSPVLTSILLLHHAFTTRWHHNIWPHHR